MRTKPTLLLPLLTSFALAQATPAPHDARIAKLFDVGDLVERWAPSSAMAAPSPFEIEKDKDKPPAAPKRNGTEAFVRLLRAFVQPTLGQGEEITGVGDRWVVAACRPEQQAWIERFLQAARGAEAKTFRVQCAVYRTNEVAFQRDLLLKLQPAEQKADAPLVVTAVLAAGAQSDEFLAALQKQDQVDALTAPQLEVWPLTTGHVAVLNQTAYVRDFDLHVAAKALIADPVVDVVQDGLTLEASAVRLEDGKLGVAVGVTAADLERPIPTVERTLPGTTKAVTVQVPNLRSTHLDAAFLMTTGQSLVLAPLPLAGTRYLFVVKVAENAATDK